MQANRVRNWRVSLTGRGDRVPSFSLYTFLWQQYDVIKTKIHQIILWILHASVVRFVTNGHKNNSSVLKMHSNRIYHDILTDETFAYYRVPAHKLQWPSHLPQGGIHWWSQYYMQSTVLIIAHIWTSYFVYVRLQMLQLVTPVMSSH